MKENIVVSLNEKKVSTMAYVMTNWKKEYAPEARQKPCDGYVELIKRGYCEQGFIEKVNVE